MISFVSKKHTLTPILKTLLMATYSSILAAFVIRTETTRTTTKIRVEAKERAKES